MSAYAIDATSSIPPYEQLRRHITSDARDGTLPPGTRLPTVRAMSADLGLAAGTVARAYRELEQAGIVETRGRAGSFIAASDGVETNARDAAHEFAQRMRALGLDADEALGYAAAALRATP